MKKIALLFLTLSLFACSGDDATETHEFRDSLVNRYKLQAIYTDIPIELNGDSIPQTDLLQEACIASLFLNSYWAEFTYNSRYDVSGFSLDVPESEYSMFLESNTPCFDNIMLSNNVDINEQTKEFTITSRFEEWEAEHGSVTSITWENGMIHFIVNKQLYTSQGWQPVTIHLKYIKWEPANI